MIDYSEFKKCPFPVFNDNASVSIKAKTGHEFYLRFDSSDVVQSATYVGESHFGLWLLCQFIKGKHLDDLVKLTPVMWQDAYSQFQIHLLNEMEQEIFFLPLEILHAAIAIYRGEEALFQTSSPLICRCFGVREDEIRNYLNQTSGPSLLDLQQKLKAGMGCRSCVEQLKRWLSPPVVENKNRLYKDRPIADWILNIDERISSLKEYQAWKLEVISFKGVQVIIGHHNELATQIEEEELMKRLQVFLGESVDSDLGFFLRRTRHF